MVVFNKLSRQKIINKILQGMANRIEIGQQYGFVLLSKFDNMITENFYSNSLLSCQCIYQDWMDSIDISYDDPILDSFNLGVEVRMTIDKIKEHQNKFSKAAFLYYITDNYKSYSIIIMEFSVYMEQSKQRMIYLGL